MGTTKKTKGVDTVAKDCGVRLMTWRTNRELTQKDLAKLSGWTDHKSDSEQPNALSPSRIGNYEQGSRRIDFESAVILERITEVPAAYWLGSISEHEAGVLAAMRKQKPVHPQSPVIAHGRKAERMESLHRPRGRRTVNG